MGLTGHTGDGTDAKCPERDGALADERDRHRMGADAVARDAAGGVGGIDESGVKRDGGCELRSDLDGFLQKQSALRRDLAAARAPRWWYC
jgi:hypothetical protein